MKQIKALAILAAMVIVGGAFAQDGPPPGGIDQGAAPQAGPRGGPGRMQDGMRARPQGGHRLLMLPVVQRDLKLTDDQIQKLKDLRPSPPPRGEGGDQAPPGRVGPEEMDKKVQAILTADQFSRLKEIRLQLEGAHALGRPEIQNKLGITDDQRQQIREVMDKYRPARQAPGNGPPQGPPPDFKTNREKMEKEVMAILTSDQKAIWKSMVGKKIDLPPMGPGGPGGMRRGPGPRAGGGPGDDGPPRGGPGGDGPPGGGPGGIDSLTD